MNALPTRRRVYWHPASVLTASCAWMICAGHGPGVLAAASPTTVGWRSDSLRPSDSWNTLSLEMSVKRQHIGKSGAVVGPPTPSASYRIERSSLSGAWKTVITVLSVDRSPTYSFAGAIAQPGAFPVARIEDDEDGAPVRAYDARGRLMKPFTSAANPTAGAAVTQARSGGREWLEALVATSSKRALRLQTLEHQFGRASRVGLLSRFSRKDADGSQEVLVDPKNVVPVELNNIHAGKLTIHRTFRYGPAPSDAVVRTSMHSETLVSPDSDERAVVDTAFSNIRLEQRR
jgi:hypothetical protein